MTNNNSINANNDNHVCPVNPTKIPTNNIVAYNFTYPHPDKLEV